MIQDLPKNVRRMVQMKSKKSAILLLLTANAKDVEVIKKVHGFWVIHLKN